MADRFRKRQGRRSRADPCHTMVRTGPYTAIRAGYVPERRHLPRSSMVLESTSARRTPLPNGMLERTLVSLSTCADLFPRGCPLTLELRSNPSLPMLERLRTKTAAADGKAVAWFTDQQGAVVVGVEETH